MRETIKDDFNILVEVMVSSSLSIYNSFCLLLTSNIIRFSFLLESDFYMRFIRWRENREQAKQRKRRKPSCCSLKIFLFFFFNGKRYSINVLPSSIPFRYFAGGNSIIILIILYNFFV